MMIFIYVLATIGAFTVLCAMGLIISFCIFSEKIVVEDPYDAGKEKEIYCVTYDMRCVCNGEFPCSACEHNKEDDVDKEEKDGDNANG